MPAGGKRSVNAWRPRWRRLPSSQVTKSVVMRMTRRWRVSGYVMTKPAVTKRTEMQPRSIERFSCAVWRWVTSATPTTSVYGLMRWMPLALESTERRLDLRSAMSVTWAWTAM